MEQGSSSRRSWADEVEEADALARSPSTRLNPNAEPFSPAGSAFGLGERLSFTDLEASIDSEASPEPADGGKVVLPRGRRKRPRRRRRSHRAGGRGGFMADARRARQLDDAAPASPPQPRLRSLVVHPARFSAEPDSDGFREVHSRRPSPGSPRPVPADLVGLCFNCLRDDHVKADCRFPSRCRSCHREGHRARNYSEARQVLAGAKRGRSPAGAGGRRGTFRRRHSPERWRAAREDTVSAHLASTGRSPSVPPCCAPAQTWCTPRPIRCLCEVVLWRLMAPRGMRPSRRSCRSCR